MLKPMVHNQQPTINGVASEWCYAYNGRTSKRKKKYPTKQAANRAIRSIKRNGTDTNPNRLLNPYQCEHCLAWHVGHSNRVKVLVQ